MKIREILEGFCSNYNSCEKCQLIDVPEYDSLPDYLEWIEGFFGFDPEQTPLLRSGRTYLVYWGDDDSDRFHVPNTYRRIPVQEDAKARHGEGVVRFYDITL